LHPSPGLNAGLTLQAIEPWPTYQIVNRPAPMAHAPVLMQIKAAVANAN
jgi:hypothetical protein